MIVCSIFSTNTNITASNYVSFYLKRSEGRQTKEDLNRKKHSQQLQINIWQCQHSAAQHNTRAHKQTTNKHIAEEEERKKRRPKKEENNTLNYSKAIFSVVWNCRTRAADSAQSIFVIMVTGIVSSWFRSSVISFVRLLIHSSIFHVSTAPVNILWTTTGKKCTQKSIFYRRKCDKQIEKRLIDGMMAGERGDAAGLEMRKRTKESGYKRPQTHILRLQFNSIQLNMHGAHKAQRNSFFPYCFTFRWNQHLSSSESVRSSQYRKSTQNE